VSSHWKCTILRSSFHFFIIAAARCPDENLTDGLPCGRHEANHSATAHPQFSFSTPLPSYATLPLSYKTIIRQSMFYEERYIGKQALRKGQRGKDRLIDDEGAARPIVQHHSAAQNQYQHQLTSARTAAESVQSTGYLVL